MTPTRRLAAILRVDVGGYSRLRGENGAGKRARQARDDLVLHVEEIHVRIRRCPLRRAW